jgi:serine/threonine-protein kinase
MDWVVPGAVLAGKFTLERKLGQGGMGAVWRAEHVHLRSPVAIKLIDQQIAQHPEALARFMREAQAAAALRSPHVVQILDYGADRGVPYIAMELLEGESLADRLAHAGRLPPGTLAHVITEVARAIAKAHELSIVHRDLKPDNIFLVRNDEVEVTKVLDFGIAKATHGLGVTSGETRTGALLGTPHYMSPEQAEGTKLVDHRTDLWALGVIAFECLLGRRPFESDALGSLLLAICTRPLPVPSAYGLDLPGFDAWFKKACARELNERFQSARELASELRRVIASSGNELTLSSDDSRGAFAATAVMQTPFVAVPPTVGVPSAPAAVPPRKHRTALAVAGLFAVAAAAGLALALHQPAPGTKSAASAASSPSAAPVATTRPTAPSVGPTATVPLAIGTPPNVAAEPNAVPEVVPLASSAPPSAASPTPASPASVRPRATPRRSEHAPPPKPPAAPSTQVNLGI